MSFSRSHRQIVCALEQDDAARKQRLAFKLEQVVAFMSLESWEPHFPGCTGKRPRQKPSRAWAKTCPHLFSSCDFLPSAFQRWILPLTFFLLPVPWEILFWFFLVFFFFPFTLLHRLVYLNLCEGWPGAEVGVSHSAMWGIPQLHHREASRGDCLKAGHIGNVSIPPVGRKEGKNIFMLPSRIYTDR